MTPKYSSMARSIARKNWGDVNAALPTTQKGCYYFSCSGHGGFVVSYDKLTQEQKDDLNLFYGGFDELFFHKVAYNAYNGKFRTESVWENPNEMRLDLKFVSFEEDCEWAVANVVLGIYLKEDSGKEDKVRASALKTLKDYYHEGFERFAKKHPEKVS